MCLHLTKGSQLQIWTASPLSVCSRLVPHDGRLVVKTLKIALWQYQLPTALLALFFSPLCSSSSSLQYLKVTIWCQRVPICCTAVNTDRRGSARSAGRLWFKRPIQKQRKWCVQVISRTRALSTGWRDFKEKQRRTPCSKHSYAFSGKARKHETEEATLLHTHAMPLPSKQY